MELYNKVSYELSRQLTLRYSTSFGQSTKLFTPAIRSHIFAIYGLVRIADEVVDTYQGKDQALRLSTLEAEVMNAIKTGYSTNPIVQAFALTVVEHKIKTSYIRAFFASMELDLTPQSYSKTLYQTYIYGSAEVIGLMCLAVFTNGDTEKFKKLELGARALGAAYQKVNFLRDIASDYYDRQRYYFPYGNFETFDEVIKQKIIDDIKNDLKKAALTLPLLPVGARRAVSLSYAYYSELLNKLDATPAEVILHQRIRVSNFKKLLIFYTKHRNASKKGNL